MISWSVIVPAFNAETTLGLCLTALQNQTVPRRSYEIMVVDDGSSDHTAQIARQHLARVIQQANAGAGAARTSRDDGTKVRPFTNAPGEELPDDGYCGARYAERVWQFLDGRE